MTHLRTFQMLAAIACLLLGAAWSSAADPIKPGRYASDRYAHTFLGATRVVLDEFDSVNDNTATLQLDKNEMTFSIFGDPRVSVVFYKPFPVKITSLKLVDPTGKNRRIFSVALPEDQSAILGKNSLRLVALTDGKVETISLRLLLVNPEDKVIQTLELRPAGK